MNQDHSGNPSKTRKPFNAIRAAEQKRLIDALIARGLAGLEKVSTAQTAPKCENEPPHSH